MACHSLNIDIEEIQSPQSHVSSDLNSTSPRSPTPSEHEWVPNCVEELKPKVGQQFDTLKEGEEFYKRYAHNVGFSVRCSSETKDKNGVKRWKYFVCSKEGYILDKEKVGEQSNSTIKSRRRSLTREWCNAKAVFKLVGEGKYELIRFHESHTHVLASPMKRQFLRSSRKNELWIACLDCGVENKKEEDGKEVLHVIDNSQANGKIREVVYNPSDHNANCSCNMSQSLGIPCRHILCILKGNGLNKIPSNYIVNRWTKLANRKPIFDIANDVLERCSKPENERKLISDAWDNFLRCMDKAGQSKEKLLVVINGTIDIEKELTEFEGDSQQSKTNNLQAFIGSNIPKEVDILPPQFSKTKGSGKRIKGGKEKAIQQQQKRTRLCKACGQHAFHDSRNCPLKSSP
ncbi:Zinc finger, PMZ-type [Sesbania bispinosa]|nr:Zinc finger, PMZ-type [Sesbania bispinosa]